MQTYLLNTIGQIPSVNRQLDYNSTFMTHEWVVFSDNKNETEKLLFLDDGKLVVSLNGKTTYSKWSYIKVNSSLIIDDGSNKYMFKILVCNKDIIFLNVDSTDKYSFLINTNSKELNDVSYKDIQWYLKKKCNVDLFSDEERKIYDDYQKEILRQKQIYEEMRSKKQQRNMGIIMGVIVGILVVVIIVGNVVDASIEKEEKKAEFERTHPKMYVTRIENRLPVDLGLSVRWATCNIGANSPMEKGNEYAWGDTTGIIYRGCRGDQLGEEYIVSVGENLFDITYAHPTRSERMPPASIVGTQYDVAKQCWGEKWRMPTNSEVEELITQCIFSLRDQYVVAIGPNGDSILFPKKSEYHGCWIYATGELDTTNPKFNQYIHSYRIGETEFLNVYAESQKSERSNMILIRAVCEK